jgi:perosamine synthetase
MEIGGTKEHIIRIGERERARMQEVLHSQFSASRGINMLGRFERAFAEKMGSRFAIGHANGTATLHSALFAAGVRAGDEIIVPPLTMSATAMAVLQADAVPVFGDVVEDTFQIDPARIEELVTPRTKAIITVALYGLSPDMDPIMELARRHGLTVIEDDAQCFMGRYKGRMVGTVGHLSSFSFQSSKHLTAGEGGVVLTNDPALADLVRRFSVLGYAGVSGHSGEITRDDIQNPGYDRHLSMGYNYRMSELCAAVALAQTERMEELVQRRIDVGKLFDEVVGDCPWFIPQVAPEGHTNSYWAFAACMTHPRVAWGDFRKKFMELGGDGVYAAWKLSYLEPMFKNRNFSGKEKVIALAHPEPLQHWGPGLCPVAEKIQPQILAFKTNYWDWDRAQRQAEILRKTINQLW